MDSKWTKDFLSQRTKNGLKMDFTSYSSIYQHSGKIPFLSYLYTLKKGKCIKCILWGPFLLSKHIWKKIKIEKLLLNRTKSKDYLWLF